MKKADHLELGQKAEEAALKFLQKKGLKLLDKNWRCKGGELDLVMLDGPVVVFVEVRLRTNQSFGTAMESISPTKQKRLVTAAQMWRVKHIAHQGRACRVDVAEVSSENFATTVTVNALSL